MSLLDVSIVNVALPSIQRGLTTTPGAVQWVVSGYALAFGLTLVAGGRLGDVLGRRRMFLLALTGFVVTSGLAGLAPTIELLIVARLAQGLTAGLLTPQNTGLIQDLFTGAERGKAFGLFGATVGLSTAVGPLAGGLILAVTGAHDGWRWVFFVNLPIGLVALVLAARLLPSGRRKEGRLRDEIDTVGALLLGAAVVAVLFPMVHEGAWWLMAVAAVLGFAFVRWEARLTRHGRAPVLDLRLFTGTPGYASGALLGAVYFCGFSGIWLVFAMYFQQGAGLTPLQSGLAVTPFALASAVAAALAGRLVEKRGRWLTVLGLSLVIVGLGVVAVILGFVQPAHPGLAIIAPMAVAGLGGGMVISPNTTLTLRCVPTRMSGAAGGALQTGQRIGTAIGTAVLSAVFHAVLTATRSYATGVGWAIATAAALVVIALGLGIKELVADRPQPHQEAPDAVPADAHQN
ncbi:MFS transporter [Labedaea rhizosphaerae]|nr:MFS transporter [Labedaea rhizosphaerae]